MEVIYIAYYNHKNEGGKRPLLKKGKNQTRKNKNGTNKAAIQLFNNDKEWLTAIVAIWLRSPHSARKVKMNDCKFRNRHKTC